jgi:hypothetical protein
MITPPVAIAAYAACGISGGDPFRTGFIAVRIAAVGFIVPFAFAFNPGLLLMGDPLNIVQSVVTAFLSVYGLAVAMQGYLLVPCRWWERVLACGGLLLIAPQTGADIADSAARGRLRPAAIAARARTRAGGALMRISRGCPGGTTRSESRPMPAALLIDEPADGRELQSLPPVVIEADLRPSSA